LTEIFNGRPAPFVGIMASARSARTSAADVLKRIGSGGTGGSNSPKAIDGVESFQGNENSARFLQRTDNPGLACLPLTAGHAAHPQPFVAKLNRTGPIGARFLINEGRGGMTERSGHIPACERRLRSARRHLMSIATDRLPADSRFWTHPKVVRTAHNARRTDPDDNIARYSRLARSRPYEAGRRAGECRRSARGY